VRFSYLVRKLSSSATATNEAGDTPLHVAAASGRCEAIISPLLAEGAKTTVKNDEQQTPLDLATAKKREKAAALLRAHGDHD